MDKIDAKILIVDDDEDILLAAKLFLKQHFNIVHTEKDPENLPVLLKNENYDVILLDMNFSRDATSGKEGFYWLAKIIENDPMAVVIFITGYGDIELANENYRALPQSNLVDTCAGCDECVVQCVNGLNLTENIQKARELFA